MVECNPDEASRGLLGSGFLGHYHGGIEWAGDRCLLKPRPHHKLPHDREVLGLTYRPYNGKLTVDAVYEDLHVTKAGIVPGDEIFAMEGLRIADLPAEDLCGIWRGEPIFGSPTPDSLRITILNREKEQTFRLS